MACLDRYEILYIFAGRKMFVQSGLHYFTMVEMVYEAYEDRAMCFARIPIGSAAQNVT